MPDPTAASAGLTGWRPGSSGEHADGRPAGPSGRLSRLGGFDDAGPNAYYDPPLTSVQQPFDRMADAVVQLLTAQANDQEAESRELTFRPELVVRGSTGAVSRRAGEGNQITPDLTSTAS